MYKLSLYNYFLDKGETVLCLNLIVYQIFAIKKEFYDLLFDYSDKLLELKSLKPNLFSALFKLGIIVDHDKNEKEILILNNRKRIFIDGNYKLTINPTLECNYSCWYCYEQHKQGKMSDEIYTAVKNHVKFKIENEHIAGLHLDWFGGEPLLYFYEIVFPLSLELKNIAKSNNIVFYNSITTNGGLITEEMVRKFEEIEIFNFQITLDGNEFEHNNIKKGSENKNAYRDVIKSFHLLANMTPIPSILLRINYTDKTLESISDIIEDFTLDIRDKINISFQKVWQIKDNNNPADLRLLENKFEEAGFLCEKNGLNFQGYTCYADRLNQAVINFDGNVFKCTARDFNTSEPDGVLQTDGKIIWEESKLSKRLSKSTFENKLCENCNLIPVCFGPCSQKMLEIEDENDYQKICYRGGVEMVLNRMLDDFYHKNIINKGNVITNEH